MGSPLDRSLALGFAAALLAAAGASAQPPASGTAAWQACCGLAPWAQAGSMTRPGGESSGPFMRGYASLVPGSTVRHHVGLKGGIPAPYTNLHNPLPATPQNAQRGQAVFEAQCASCHGATGLGDGAAAEKLVPPPAQLGWLAKVPASRRDAFIYWSIAEGGLPIGSGMPPFKGKLSDEEMWAVTGYSEGRLPKPNAPH